MILGLRWFMSSRAARSWFAVLLVLFSWGQALASGLYISEVASPGSVGTAGVANVVNNKAPDSAWTNPAGMTGLDVDGFLGGMQVLLPSVKFDSTSATTVDGDDGGNAGNPAVIPGAYLVKVLSPDTRFGVSVVAPLGGGIDYRKNFVGRYQAIESTLQGIGITPAFAWQLTDRISLGAGFTFLYTQMDLDVALNQSAINPAITDDARVKLDGIDDWSYQGTVGAQIKLTDRLLFGVIYRTKSDVELDGDAKVRNVDSRILGFLTRNFDEIEMDFDYPQLVKAGLMFQATDRLVLMVDADWEDWSDFGDFGVEVSSGPRGGDISSNLDLHWKDTWHVGAAAVYRRERHVFSVGAAYDSSPVDDKDRVAFLPADEQAKIGAAWGLNNTEIGSFSYALGGTFIWLGDGKMDQTAQGERFKGEFEDNFLFFVAGSVGYKF